MSDPKNPLAFPYEGRGPSHHDREPGMTLRDWFAGQALAGYMAKFPQGDRITIVSECFEVADAMLAVRVRK